MRNDRRGRAAKLDRVAQSKRDRTRSRRQSLKEAPGVVRCECYKRARTPRLLEFARIPPRYATATLENYETLDNQSLERAKLAAEAFVRDYPHASTSGLVFMGRPGLGKTHLAIGIIRELMHTRGIACLFCDFPDLLREIQNSYNPLTQGSESLILAPILDADVLVLDDLGSMKWSEWVQDMVAHIINDRYKHGHATVLTTNYLDPDPTSKAVEEGERMRRLKELGIITATGDLDNFRVRELERLGVYFRPPNQKDESLQDRIGDRLRSRLTQMCKTVRMYGEDFRRSIATRNIR